MTTRSNDPSLWKQFLPKPKAGGHKYDRGVAVIYGAPKMTGATRLAAEACARVGAGLVKVIAPEGTGNIYRASLPAHIIVEDEYFEDYIGQGGKHTYLSNHGPILDERVRSVLAGPGCTPGDFNKSIFWEATEVEHIKGIVLDAGAFMSWSGDIMAELQAFGNSSRVVVTPHEGEFEKFFLSHDYGYEVLHPDGKVKRAEKASEKLSAAVVLKGAQTVIAGDGNTIVQNRDVPSLSTAGTGDVLAGMIAGLIAQGMEVQMASAAAVWIHAEAAARFGPGLVASDLPGLIPPILNELSAA